MDRRCLCAISRFVMLLQQSSKGTPTREAEAVILHYSSSLLHYTPHWPPNRCSERAPTISVCPTNFLPSPSGSSEHTSEAACRVQARTTSRTATDGADGGSRGSLKRRKCRHCLQCARLMQRLCRHPQQHNVSAPPPHNSQVPRRWHYDGAGFWVRNRRFTKQHSLADS